MKFTAIYAYENEEWSTPLSIINQFKEIGWDTEIVSIGSNRLQNWNDTNIKTWLDSSPQTDIVMYFDWGRFDSPLLNKKLLPSAFWVQESGDDPQNFDRNYPKASRFDITVTPDADCNTSYLKRGINSFWLTHFADTKVHYPEPSTPIKYIGVTSRGMGGSGFLDTLTHHGEGSFGNRNGMDSTEHRKFLNSGAMVVQASRHREITRRIFEAMACKKLVLTDRLNDSTKLHELFTDGVDIVYYDNLIDCINKMNYYYDNPEAANKIAESGYKKVLEHHTQVQRVQFIIEKFNEWKNL